MTYRVVGGWYARCSVRPFMTGLILLGLLAQTVAPPLKADVLGPRDPRPPPNATGPFVRESNGTVCFEVSDEDRVLSQLCRSEFGDFPRPLGGGPFDVPGSKPASVSQTERTPAVEELGETFPKQEAGSQWGVVSLVAGAASIEVRTYVRDPLGPMVTGPVTTSLEGIAGLGARYGLRKRVADTRLLIPGIAVMAGAAFRADSLRPFAELRGELMSVSPGGPLQPNFTVYGTTGATVTPLGGSAPPLSIQPHVGFGLGWNWLPHLRGASGWNVGSLGSGGGAAGLIAVPVALGILAIVLAGRVEVRYTARPVSGSGSDFVSIMLGAGT